MENDILVKARPGYACINLSLEGTSKNYRLSAVEKRDEEKIVGVIWNNIRLLREIIDFNVTHNLYVYRLSSDLVPFCTQPYVKEIYKHFVQDNEEMQTHFDHIQKLQSQYDLRLSIHPGQFNVLASPKSEVVSRSIEEINMQTEWVRRVGGKNVVLHIGGGYGDKKAALKRFKENVAYVDTNLLSVENDDKTYNVEEVVEVCQDLKLKWVYDYHHDRCHPCENKERVCELIKAYPPNKFHLSTGTPHSHSHSHDDFISREDYKAFVEFMLKCNVKDLDVIFEAKQKNKAISHILSPIECGYWKLSGKEKANKVKEIVNTKGNRA